MTLGKRIAFPTYVALLALPSIHVFLVVLTMIVSIGTPGGAYYRIFGVNPVAGAVGMITEGPVFFVALFVCGTAWWYFIGLIAWKSRRGRITPISAGLGAVLALFSGAVGASASRDALYQDLHDRVLSVGPIFQYACIALICTGSFVTAYYAATAALRKNKAVS